MVVTLEIVERLVLVGAHHVGHILLRMDIAYAALRVALEQEVTDRVRQMRLTEPHAAIYEQRVVSFAGTLRDLHRRRARELIRLACHEGREAEVGIEA